MDVFELLALRGTGTILKELSKNKRVKYSDLVKAVGFSTTTTRALKAMEKPLAQCPAFSRDIQTAEGSIPDGCIRVVL